MPIEAMCIINPKMCKQLAIQVEVEQRNEGPVPHVHVYHDKTRNPKRCSYVRLDKADYCTHHKVVKLPKGLNDEFIQLMTSVWERHVYISNSETRQATGYEAAVDTWVETFEDGDYGKFNLDSDGNLIMPDYSEL